MKQTAILLLLPLFCWAARYGIEIVDEASVQTVKGIGGYCTLTYALAEGDKVTIEAQASRQLQAMIVSLYPGTVLGRVKDTRRIHYSFTMPEEGIVSFRFVSDRGGSNRISYKITREPAPGSPEHYASKVQWEKRKDGAGDPIPVRTAEP